MGGTLSVAVLDVFDVNVLLATSPITSPVCRNYRPCYLTSRKSLPAMLWTAPTSTFLSFPPGDIGLSKETDNSPATEFVPGQSAIASNALGASLASHPVSRPFVPKAAISIVVVADDLRSAVSASSLAAPAAMSILLADAPNFLRALIARGDLAAGY